MNESLSNFASKLDFRLFHHIFFPQTLQLYIFDKPLINTRINYKKGQLPSFASSLNPSAKLGNLVPIQYHSLAE